MAESFKHLSEENFQEEIKSGLVLVDFYADWCGPCRMLTPILENVAKALKDKKVTIAKLNIEKAQRIAATYQITSIPTLMLFENGEKKGVLIGLRDEKTIKEFILSAPV